MTAIVTKADLSSDYDFELWRLLWQQIETEPAAVELNYKTYDDRVGISPERRFFFFL